MLFLEYPEEVLIGFIKIALKDFVLVFDIDFPVNLFFQFQYPGPDLVTDNEILYAVEFFTDLLEKLVFLDDDHCLVCKLPVPEHHFGTEFLICKISNFLISQQRFLVMYPLLLPHLSPQFLLILPCCLCSLSETVPCNGVQQ